MDILKLNDILEEASFLTEIRDALKKHISENQRRYSLYCPIYNSTQRQARNTTVIADTRPPIRKLNMELFRKDLLSSMEAWPNNRPFPMDKIQFDLTIKKIGTGRASKEDLKYIFSVLEKLDNPIKQRDKLSAFEPSTSTLLSDSSIAVPSSSASVSESSTSLPVLGSSTTLSVADTSAIPSSVSAPVVSPSPSTHLGSSTSAQSLPSSSTPLKTGNYRKGNEKANAKQKKKHTIPWISALRSNKTMKFREVNLSNIGAEVVNNGGSSRRIELPHKVTGEVVVGFFHVPHPDNGDGPERVWRKLLLATLERAGW